MKLNDLNLKQMIAFKAMGGLQEAMKEYFVLDEDTNIGALTINGLSTHKDNRSRIVERVKFYLQILDNPMGKSEYDTMCSDLLAAEIKEAIMEHYSKVDIGTIIEEDGGNIRMIDYYFDVINIALDQNNQKVQKINDLIKLVKEL